MRLRSINLFYFFLGLLLGAAQGYAQAPAPTEYQIKAAFLYNFAKFVDWPPQAFTNENSEFVIGILGDNPFGEDLARTVAGKNVNERTIAIQKFTDAAETKNCHILFISTSEKNRLPEVFEKLKGRSILTVGEMERFTESGGIINFVREASKIRFQINDPAAKAIQLKISSKLMSLAVSASP